MNTGLIEKRLNRFPYVYNSSAYTILKAFEAAKRCAFFRCSRGRITFPQVFDNNLELIFNHDHETALNYL